MKTMPLARGAFAILLVAAALSWAGALLSSSRPAAPALLVYGEPVALRGSEWPVRVVAAWPSEKRRASFHGHVVVGDARTPLVDGLARVTLPRAGDEVTVVVAGEAEGVPGQVPLRVQLIDELPAAPPPRYVPWTAELADGTAEHRAAAPLYPVTGRLPASLPAGVVVVGEDAVRLVMVAPHAARPPSVEGRRLRTDPSGLVVRVPPVVAPGAELEVQVAQAYDEGFHLDLVVNGHVRDMRVVKAGEARELRLRLPDDARDGWFAVHVSSSPLASVSGATAIGIIRPDADTLDLPRLVEVLSRHPSFDDTNDPLLTALRRTPPDDTKPLRALLGRLRVDDVRAQNLAPTAAEQATLDERRRAAAAARFRLPFRVSGGLFVALAAAIAFTSAWRGHRWRAQADTTARRQLAPVLWSLLALFTSLSALWVLDWAIGLMLSRPTG